MTEDARLAEALADRYRIEREIGAGGMATVYLAEDLRHHRKVAVKVLKPDLAESVGKERFLREIEIAAALTHPHILPVHDSGETDGFLYYVMPFIEGESLRTRLRREGELPVAEAVRLLRDVVDALASAHKRGVVHRDIKPDNVLLAENHALVADFGVAKAVSEATGGRTLTSEGAALGTPSYMSPEQASADPHVDHRADIYAVGALAYELLAGEPPFTGATPHQILSAHVTQAPEPLTERRRTVPPRLAEIVMRCLEKKPADRWQTAEELLGHLEGMVTPTSGLTPVGLPPVRGPSRVIRSVGGMAATLLVIVAAAYGVRRLGGGGPVAEETFPPKLVVVPLENRTGDESLDIWVETATSHFTRALDLTGVIEVVPFSTVRDAQRGTDGAVTRMPTAELAAAVGGTVAVVGQLFSAGDELRLDLELLHPFSGDRLGSVASTTGPIADAEGVVSDATERLAAAVLAQFDPTGSVVMRRMGPPENPESVQHTLMGLDRFCRREYGAAAQEFEAALALDSLNMTAWAWLAGTYGQFTSRIPDAQEAVRRAEALSGRATRYERNMTRYLRGWLFGDWEMTHRAAVENMALDAVGFAYGAGWSSMRTNRPAEALRHLEAYDTTAACWRNWEPYWEVKALSLHLLGRHQEELAVARDARARFPESQNILGLELRALIGLGEVTAADSLLDLIFSAPFVPSPAAFAVDGSREYRVHGHEEAATRAIDRALAWYERDPEAHPNAIARALYYGQRYEEAFPQLQALSEAAPDNATRLTYYGLAAEYTGRSELAREVDRRLQELAYPIGRGYLAAARGDAEAAVRFINEALDGGLSRVGMRSAFLHDSPEFIPLRGNSAFDQLAAPRG